MKIEPETTLTDLAFIVGTALEQAGVTAVLSGGGAATVYAPRMNQSRDLDFVLGFWSSLGVSDACVRDLGFKPQNGIYVHPNTLFTLEFPPGPLMIGNSTVTRWTTLRRGDYVLNILTPTDCVCDRLSWFLFYQRADYSALEQALAVASRQKVDLKAVQEWATREGAPKDRIELFASRASQKPV